MDVAIDGAELVITPRGWWRLLSLRRQVRIPSAAIRSARVSAYPTVEVPVRWRVGGTGTLTICAGYWIRDGMRSWWCYRYGERAVVVDVALPRLQAAVVMTDDDDATVDLIESVRVA